MLAASLVAPCSAWAQTPEEADTLREEIARLRAELESLEARLGKMETGTVRAQTSQPAEPAVETRSETQVAWKGAPQFSSSEGFTFDPRGRLQLDMNSISRPEGMEAPLGWAADVRRAYLGVDGTLGGGFGYRLELDFASGSAQFTDAWLSFERGPLTLTLGHHRITTLDDMTSDLETSFLERAGFTQAFGFERRLGLSATYEKGDLQLSAGMFSDDLETLGTADVRANSYSFDTRLVFMPKFGDTRLHLGGSFHHRELNDLTQTVQYRARPGARTTDMRFVDTDSFDATAETGYGLEFAVLHGPFHGAAEGFWQHVETPGTPDPLFFGAYGEIGYVFAGGKARGYEDGAFTSIKPTRGLDKGGWGAWQVNVRYDWLDLNHGAVVGGRQQTWGASLVWVPVERVKFLANYLRVDVAGTPILAGTRDDYAADVFGLRAQYEF